MSYKLLTIKTLLLHKVFCPTFALRYEKNKYKVCKDTAGHEAVC